ncbi:MAG: hypothetical protein PHP79_07035 [Clostridia bacterium]|nr:hypothetical protein [Clostridia bacterium]
MSRKRNRFFKAIIIIFMIAIFIFSPACASIRSYAVMFPYSYLHQRNSVLAKNQISFRIPGGKHTSQADWYPFVITFNASEGLSSYLGESVEFTILYNFGHFNFREGTSTYYDPNSPYYSSFYGGYIIKPADEGRKIGFQEDNTVNVEELAKITEYDQKYLVLSSLGCPVKQRVFNEEISTMQYEVEYAGYDNWVQVDSMIQTNSPVHEYREFQRGYLQYGKPMGRFHFVEDFPVINLNGRVYVRYFKDLQATVVLYIMAPSWITINEADEEILSKTEIGFSDSRQFD